GPAPATVSTNNLGRGKREPPRTLLACSLRTRAPERPFSYETPPDDSPRVPLPRRHARTRRRDRRRGGEQGSRAHHLPGRRTRRVHRRLRRAASRWTASGERPHGGEEVAGSRRGSRQGEVLDDVRRRRLHALPL